MAYAIQSLVQILEQDQHKHHLSTATRSEMDSFLEKARILRDLVEANSFEITEDLGSRIRDAAHNAEDVIEEHIADQLVPISKEEEEELELIWLMEEFDSIKEQIAALKRVDIEKGQADVSKQSPAVVSLPPRIYGFDKDIDRLKNKLLSEQKSKLQVIPIVGIAGSGKTQLADILYSDSSIISHVDIRAWTTISQEINLRFSLLALLDCLIHVTDEMGRNYDNQRLGECLSAALVNKRYLIVLDDIWNTNSWDELRKFFPENDNGSRIILTTREWNLAEYAKTSLYPHQIHLISDNASWKLLGEKVFGDVRYCPTELVEIGFKIACNCRGHPLTVVTIAGILSASGNMLDVWQRVEAEQLDSTDMRVKVDSIKEDKMSKIHQVDPSLKGFVEFFAKDGLRLMSQLMHGQSNLKIIPLVGVSESIGKTILARLLYDHALRGQDFDVHAWVSIKQIGTLPTIQRNVLATLQDLLDSLHKYGLPQVYDDDLGVRVHKTLMNRRYLIVVDGIRDVHSWEAICQFFPDEGNGSRIILTAREWSDDYDGINPFLLDSYWEFLLGKVATLIPTSEKKLEFWKLVGEEHASSAKNRNGDLNLELLSISYNTLPCHLKPCFLYVGAFPEDHEIETRKIIPMWIAEGFVRPVAENSLEDTASTYLESLISRNLLFACGRGVNGKATSFKIHDVLWKFCQKKSLDEKFFWSNGLNIEGEGEIVRRMSVHPKCRPGDDEDKDMSFVRSFLCMGPASRDLAPMFLVLRLLRVLDVLGLQLVRFPEELLQLTNLRYMALTCYSDLPSSISIFRNLQTLFASGVDSLPSELWEMTQLRYVECSENCIWNISGKGESVSHEEMHSLINIPASEVTDEFLRHNPNLRNLSIIFDDSLHVSIPLDCLNNLENLKCSYVGSKRRHDLLHYLRLPVSLKNLTLSSFTIRPEFMTANVGSLPLLGRFMLEKCDFVDLEWEPAEGGFTRLRCLEMEDLNLVRWRANSTHFPRLEQLVIRGCHAMEEIPFAIGEIPTLELIHVDEKCSRSVLTSAKRIKSEQINLGNDLLQIIEPSSLTPERELAMQYLEKSPGEDLCQFDRQKSTVIMSEEAEAKGYTALSNYNFVDAIRHYTDAINLDDSDHLLYINRLKARFCLHQFSEGLLDAEKIVQLRPDLSIGYIQLGHSYFMLDNFKDAISAYEKALEIDPHNDKFKSHLSNVKARVAESTSHFLDAIQHYTDAINLDPLDQTYAFYNNRSIIHARLNQFSEALSDAQKTVQYNPYWSEGYFNLGSAHFNLGNYKDALSAYKKGLEIDPGDHDLNRGFLHAEGTVALSTGKFVAAIQHYTDAINLDPSNYIYYSNRSQAHASLNQFSKAMSDAQEAVRFEPNCSEGYSRLGDVYLGLHIYTDAISTYEKALKSRPTDAKLKSALSIAKAALARRKEKTIIGIRKRKMTGQSNKNPSVMKKLKTSW